MTNRQISGSAPEFDDADLVRVDIAFAILWERRWAVLAAALLGGIIALGFALREPNVYRAQAVLLPVKDDAGLASGLRSQLGGLASIAGIDVGGGSAGRTVESVATLASAGFVREFIVAKNLLPVLFATRWDEEAKRWAAGQSPPSLEDGVQRFRDKVMRVAEDRKTGLVTISIEWTDPGVAAEWATELVARVNEKLRLAAIEDSQRSIEYLEQELAKTSIIEVQRSLFGLIESKVSAATFANVQREYAFKVVDPAVAPDPKRKVGPRRSLWALSGGFLAGSFAACLLLWTQRRRWAFPQPD